MHKQEFRPRNNSLHSLNPTARHTILLKRKLQKRFFQPPFSGNIDVDYKWTSIRPISSSFLYVSSYIYPLYPVSDRHQFTLPSQRAPPRVKRQARHS